MPSLLLIAAELASTFLLARSLNITDVRPSPEKRTFNSSLVNYVVDALGGPILPGNLGTLFRNCLPNTLDTTVLRAGEVKTMAGHTWDSFVVTGDIPAMWLRDSMNQVYPYLGLLNASIAAGNKDGRLEDFLFGVLHRQTSSVLIDPYANAFAWWGPQGQTGANKNDLTFKLFEPGGGVASAMQDLRLYERKWEIDSLLSVLKLASGLYEVAPGRAAEHLLADPTFVPAVGSVLATLEEMASCKSREYTFQRRTPEPTDSLLHGVGFPCKDTGMVRSHFRPSDDAVVYAFNVPGNAMAAVELRRLRALLLGLRGLNATRRYPWASEMPEMEARAARLENAIRAGIERHGTMVFQGERVFAYEVDGFGNAIFMDDANVPSLLSLPFLGFVEADDPMYRATRRLVLSEHNPWYFRGDLGIGGVGGPHEGADMIWPMSLVMQALTSRDLTEVSSLLQQLVASSEPNSLMHEAFHKDSFKRFTRPWFAWANALFGDLVLRISTDPVLYKAANLTRPLDLVALIRKRPMGFYV